MKNIFISHAWRYSSAYSTVVDWLDNARGNRQFDYKNYSVPIHDPLIDPSSYYGKAQLKDGLTEQIRHASVVIIISGMYAAHSEWIEYEIHEAVRMGKYIIGLKPWGQERIPFVILNNANVMVGWNRDSLINAIVNS